VAVGRITGVHGVRGELKVAPYVDACDFDFNAVFISGREGRPLKVLRARPHKAVFLLELEGIVDRDEAGALVGAEVCVPRSALPPPVEGEYYHSDLIGMEAWTDEAVFLGRIAGIITTGGNDVFEVEGPLGEVLIPAIEDVVLRVDTQARRITVHLLDGLVPERGGASGPEGG